jgi:hypothetical protein
MGRLRLLPRTDSTVSAQHRGTYQYWKPRRIKSYEDWSRIMFRVAVVSVAAIFLFVVIVTVILVWMELPS